MFDPGLGFTIFPLARVRYYYLIHVQELVHLGLSMFYREFIILNVLCCLQEGKKQQRPSFPPMDWNFDGNEYDPMIPNDYERVVRGKLQLNIIVYQ